MSSLPLVDLTFSQIRTVMGGAPGTPISLSQYYSNLTLTSGVAGIPVAGSPISLASFRGKSKSAPGFIFASSVLQTRHLSIVESLLGLNSVPNKTLTLLYRASRDGFTAAAFHSRCDSFADVFFAMKAPSGHIATGFSSAKWTSSGSFVAASLNSCWLNPLENAAGLPSSTRFFNSADAAESICDLGTYGPIFGGGFDLMVPNRFDVNLCNCASVPTTYKGLTGTTLFGAADFFLNELEVFTCR